MLTSLYILLIFSLRALVADFAAIAKDLQRTAIAKDLQRTSHYLRVFLELVARSTAICAIAEHTLFETTNQIHTRASPGLRCVSDAHVIESMFPS